MSTRQTPQDREKAILDEINRRKTPSQRQAEAAIRGDRRGTDVDVDVIVDDEPETKFWGDDRPALSTSERQAARATRFSRRAS